MKTQIVFRQYIWLLDTIYRAERISFEEINQRWLNTEMSEGVEMTRRTFIRHRAAIEEMFGIYINCNKKDGFRYYIGNPEDLQTANIQRWMINSLSTSTLLSESKDLNEQIVLEDIPSGQFFLMEILQAIRNRQLLHLTYKRFDSDEPKTKDVEPYCVKLQHQRWYVVVRNPKSEHTNLTTYALDRIQHLDIIEGSHFKIPKNFSASEYFKNSFGIFVDEKNPPEHIIIRAYGVQADYLRTLPLHYSQKEITTNSNATESYTDFEYCLSVTIDLVNELLSKSDGIEVLEPESLRLKMQDSIEKMSKRYQQK